MKRGVVVGVVFLVLIGGFSFYVFLQPNTHQNINIVTDLDIEVQNTNVFLINEGDDTISTSQLVINGEQATEDEKLEPGERLILEDEYNNEEIDFKVEYLVESVSVPVYYEQVNENFDPKQGVHGVVSYGDPIEGANVDLIAPNGTVVSSTKTTADGEYEFETASKGSSIRVISANDTVTPLLAYDSDSEFPLYASYQNKVVGNNIDFTFTDGVTTHVNGTINSGAASRDVIVVGNIEEDPVSPIHVATLEQLQGVDHKPYSDHKLIADINASETRSWDDGHKRWLTGEGFRTIGSEDRTFSGHFDGNSHEIRGLYINRSENVALFSVVEDGTIENVHLRDANVSGDRRVAGLVGEIKKGKVKNVSVTGNMSGTFYIGGVTGITADRGTITDASSTVHATGEKTVGGLVGTSRGQITRSYSNGTVEAERGNVGGLVGFNFGGETTYSYSRADVSVTRNYPNNRTKTSHRLPTSEPPPPDRDDYDTGPEYTTPENGYYSGGLLGQHTGGELAYTYATGNVTNPNKKSGGLVGRVSHSTTVEQSYATGQKVTGKEDAGGLIGETISTDITTSYWDTERMTVIENGTKRQNHSDGGTPLRTGQITGNNNELDGFDVSEWIFVDDEYPTLRVHNSS